jgi:KDO2-lipid IV(A) lauroyltransferase
MHLFAWCLTERYESLCAGVEMAFTTAGEEHWHAAVAAPGGFILATAHMGNWELGAAVGSDHGGRRVHLVREEEGDPQAQEYIRGLIQERFGDRYVTHFATADPALGLRLRSALQEGDIVALQSDRPRSGGTSIRTSLFGRPFELPRGLLALARTTGVPILPAFTLRTGRRRYEIRFAPAVTVGGAGDRLAAETAAAGQLARTLEDAIRRHPHQWFCFYRLWPDSST